MEEVACLRVTWNVMWEHNPIWVFLAHVSTWHLLLGFCIPSSLKWFCEILNSIYWVFYLSLISIWTLLVYPSFWFGNCGLWECEILAVLLLNFSCRSLVFSGTVHWFEGRQAFIHYCGLHQVWREPGKLSAYIALGSLRCAKTVKTRNN